MTDKEIIECLEKICEIASGNIKYAKDNSFPMNTYNIGFDHGCISVARKMIAVIKGKEIIGRLDTRAEKLSKDIDYKEENFEAGMQRGFDEAIEIIKEVMGENQNR